MDSVTCSSWCSCGHEGGIQAVADVNEHFFNSSNSVHQTNNMMTDSLIQVDLNWEKPFQGINNCYVLQNGKYRNDISIKGQGKQFTIYKLNITENILNLLQIVPPNLTWKAQFFCQNTPALHIQTECQDATCRPTSTHTFKIN